MSASTSLVSPAIPRQASAAYSASDLTVVICCYADERWHDTLNAVRSVQEQEAQPGQVVVVVDHNDDLLLRLASTLRGVKVVANRFQRGLSGARNTGIAESRGRIVAFLDDDAQAAPGWAAALLAAYGSPDVLGVGGAVEPNWLADRPAWFPPEFDWVVGCSYRGSPEVPANVRNFIGANMSFRRDVLETVGGFASSLGRVGKHPAGCEETELCIRATRTFSGVLRHEPAALVRHSVPAERSRWSYLRRRCHAEGISKAVVAHLATSNAALETERRYVRRVLPVGVLRGIWATLRGEPAGLKRSAAILFGLTATTFGYLQGLPAAKATAAAATEPEALSPLARS